MKPPGLGQGACCTGKFISLKVFCDSGGNGNGSIAIYVTLLVWQSAGRRLNASKECRIFILTESETVYEQVSFYKNCINNLVEARKFIIPDFLSSSTIIKPFYSIVMNFTAANNYFLCFTINTIYWKLIISFTVYHPYILDVIVKCVISYPDKYQAHRNPYVLVLSLISSIEIEHPILSQIGSSKILRLK